MRRTRRYMLCGAGSFPREDGDPGSPQSLPRASGRRQGGRSNSNPYSARGLDKFSEVLADLQARREMIKAEAREQGATLVRFMYSNCDGCWVPIVVKPRDRRAEPEREKKGAGDEPRKRPAKFAAAKRDHAQPRMDAEQMPAQAPEPAPNCGSKKSLFTTEKGIESKNAFFRWDPSYYWPAVVVLILLCLAFGRVFAICCTSVCWYSLPRTRVGGNGNVRKGVGKEYRIRASKHQPGACGQRVAWGIREAARN